MWHHPKYYKELRKRNKLAESRQPVVGGQQQSDQVISSGSEGSALPQRAPGPGHKPQAVDLKINLERVRKQYTSDKHQATSCNVTKPQAPSDKQQASSSKRR